MQTRTWTDVGHILGGVVGEALLVGQSGGHVVVLHVEQAQRKIGQHGWGVTSITRELVKKLASGLHNGLAT
jgi:hypothetical protein